MRGFFDLKAAPNDKNNFMEIFQHWNKQIKQKLLVLRQCKFKLDSESK